MSVIVWVFIFILFPCSEPITLMKQNLFRCTAECGQFSLKMNSTNSRRSGDRHLFKFLHTNTNTHWLRSRKISTNTYSKVHFVNKTSSQSIMIEWHFTHAMHDFGPFSLSLLRLHTHICVVEHTHLPDSKLWFRDCFRWNIIEKNLWHFASNAITMQNIAVQKYP